MMKNPYEAESTLEKEFPIYVERDADDKIIEYLEEDSLCCISAPRKFGKSSLLMRAIEKLKTKYVCIYFELPSVDEEQDDNKKDWDHIKQAKYINIFYQKFLDGLITQLESKLKAFDLDLGFSSIEKWNQKCPESGPEIFFRYVSEKFINKIKIIVFIDEIDFVKSFPFPTDNFFREIRGLLNDQTKPNIFNFCFAGVTKVSNLIANPVINAFNLGKRIELTGFKLTQNNPVPEKFKVLITNELESKCENPEKVIKIVIKRTGGQPFLTQKFLSLIINHVEEKIGEDEEYEHLLNLEDRYIITNWRRNDNPVHFKTIERQIIDYQVVNYSKTMELKNSNETAQRLEMYRNILTNEQEVRVDDLVGKNKETMESLILSGLVVVNNQGLLKAYCPIYAKIFDGEWIKNWLDRVKPLRGSETIRRIDISTFVPLFQNGDFLRGQDENILGLSSVFNCKESHPRGNLIFVHGLAGHPWGTWHPESKKDPQNVNFWPFWLGEELQIERIYVNVWTFGYQRMPRFDLASNLLQYLEVNDIGDHPLIFVTHSMGGLLVKDVIRTAQNFDDQKAIIEQTQGIVFLSTPHQGSHLASLIDNINVLTKATVNVEELRAHSPQLRQLNEWYRQNVEKLRIKTQVFYETQPMSQVLVVDEDSANPGIKDVRPVAIPANHSSIAKPRKNDLVYLSVKKVCQKIFTPSGEH